MAQIAFARSFDGSDDQIEMTVGGIETDITGMSIAALIKPTDAAAFRDILVIEDPFGFAFGLGTENELYLYDGSTLAQSAANFAQQSNGWMLVAVTKPNGSAVPRWHKYVFASTTWTHTDDETTLADPTTPTASSNVYVGGQTNYLGLIANLGYWASTELSNGQLEGMVSTIGSWEASTPTALWLLDQTSEATPVEDRVGTSDELAITGTTATAIADLNFDVGGVAPELRPVTSGLRW